MFAKLESAIKEFEDEGGRVEQDSLYESSEVLKRRTVIIVTQYGGIHVLQSILVFEDETLNRVFLTRNELDFLRDKY